jgi:hypothetical protein
MLSFLFDWLLLRDLTDFFDLLLATSFDPFLFFYRPLPTSVIGRISKFGLTNLTGD